VIISFIVSSVVVAANIFGDSGPPLAWFIWPPFAFYHILNAISNAAFSNVRGPYQAKDLVPGDPVDTALKFLFAEGLIMFLMMFYLKSVLPSEYGLSKPWYFIFTDPIKGLIKLFGKGSNPYKRKYRVTLRFKLQHKRIIQSG
jgi:hypothetical protein